MPLPEGMSELTFAGALNRRRVRLVRRNEGLPICADADFCITGTVDPDRLLPEGPFGDHLGYYSLEHPFPVMHVEQVYHREDAIWPFTVVGRPPQEDTMFGQLIHEMTGPMIPVVLPGVHAVHAVDAAGVHPLLFAIGSERYMPFLDAARPQELLTQANAILGQGQLSLAKFLLIAARDDDTQLDIHDERRVPPPHPATRRLDARLALSYPNNRRHARLLRRGFECWLESGNCRSRPAEVQTGQGSAERLAIARRILRATCGDARRAGGAWSQMPRAVVRLRCLGPRPRRKPCGSRQSDATILR